MSSPGQIRSKSQPNLNDQDPEIRDLLRRKRTKSEPLSGLAGIYQIEEVLKNPITQAKINEAKLLFEKYFPKEMECSGGEELGTSYERWDAMMSDANFRKSALKAIGAAETAFRKEMQLENQTEFKI